MAQRPVRRRRKVPQPTLFQRLRRDFLTGLVVVLPMFLTVYLVWTTIGFIDAKVVPLIPGRYNPENIFGRNIFGLGVIVFLAFTTTIGALTKGIMGRQILGFGERLVERMPVVRSIYNGLKQIAETIFSQSNNSFQTACLIEYPRKGVFALAFVSTDTNGEVLRRSGADKLVSVFVPTTPNPTSGFLLFLPKDEVKPLDMTVEEAAKMIISAGLVEPEDKQGSNGAATVPTGNRRTRKPRLAS
ncbi:DUF502 domain-containing protein [Amaricoccus tamworthensis]|uniref:DUF502 domain-containing protein n=1 Tax=Amaricoccus tamworthensis TaxID=57002 RepID=UPI003C7EA9D2